MPQCLRGQYRLATLTLIAAAATGCREVAPAFGPTIPAARSNAEGLFGGIAQRFTNVQRNPKFTVGRAKLGKYALTPSAIYNDTSIWTAIGADGSRTVTVDGEFAGNRYLFSARPLQTTPNEPGDSRHLMVLRRLSKDEFEWFTNVDIVTGTITGHDMANVIAALLRSAERRSAATIRADYRESFPRTTASLGRLLTLDSLRVTHDADSATTTTLGIRINPDRIRAAMPAFAAYLDKYSTVSRYRNVVTDRRGTPFIELSGANNFMTIKVRSVDGRFVPLSGPPRPMPAELQLHTDFSTRILLFRVGFSQLVGDLSIIRGENERGWLIRYTREPDWRLPPAVGYLIKTPLRRPFEGQGILFRMAMVSSPGRQSILARRTSATVQESGILRFLNRLSGTAMGEFVGKAEAEENRFSAEVFHALRQDARALLQ